MSDTEKENQETPETPSLREELPSVTAKNIAALRTARKMTQLELGEALNYSDKAISKWERGEAVPDAYVLLELSRIFGVSVDWILTPHGEEAPPAPYDDRRHIHVTVTLLSFFGVFAAATFAFVILALLGNPEWQIFIYTVPVALVVLLIFNSIWGQRHRNFTIVALLLPSLLLAAYVALLPQRLWMIFLLAAPSEVIVFLSRFLTVKKKK